MDLSRSPTAYVAENNLVGAPVEGEALGPAKVGPPSSGNVRGGKSSEDLDGGTPVSGRGREWEGLINRKPGKGITFEM